MQNVLAAFSVTEFNDVAQNGNQHVAVASPFVNLVRDKFRKLHLFYVKLYGIADARLHDHLVERSVNKIGNAERKRFFDLRCCGFCGNHDDWSALDPSFFIHGLENFETITPWHNHVQEDKRNLLCLFFENFEGFVAVFSFNDIIFVTEQIR